MIDVEWKYDRNGLPITEEEYTDIRNWYRLNKLTPLTDGQLLKEGFHNIIFLGVAWYLA